MGGRGSGEWGRIKGGGGGVRMDVNEEVKFLLKLKKNRGSGVWVGFEGGGYGGCKRRIEVFAKIQK